jgi:hypothetical protein
VREPGKERGRARRGWGGARSDGGHGGWGWRATGRRMRRPHFFRSRGGSETESMTKSWIGKG